MGPRPAASPVRVGLGQRGALDGGDGVVQAAGERGVGRRGRRPRLRDVLLDAADCVCE